MKVFAGDKFTFDTIDLSIFNFENPYTDSTNDLQRMNDLTPEVVEKI